MSVVRVGSTSKYAENWATIFGGTTARKAGKKVAKKPVKRPKAAKRLKSTKKAGRRRG